MLGADSIFAMARREGAIIDLDSAAPAPPPTTRDRAVLLGLVSGCVALGLFVLSARAPQPLVRPTPDPPRSERAYLPTEGIPNAFSVLARAQPAPSTALELPRDVGVVIQQRGPNGETGLIARDYAVTMVRLRSGDVVTFGTVAPSEPVGTPVPVRGTSGVTFTDAGLAVVRWSENGAFYEMSSRTLAADRLVEIAALLR